MVEPSLEYLGRQMKEMQASMRDVRRRIDLLEHKIDRIEPYLAAAVAGLEERLAERLQNEADAVQAQFAQVHETMATNLTMVLAAIGERR
jgi:prefoldin subunit 5